MSLSELIAKKKEGENVFQTFEGHTTDCLLILKNYLTKNKEVLRGFCENFEIDFNTFCNLLFLSVYLHDIGKLTKEFQERIKKGESCGYVSHAFFGLPFVNSDLPENQDLILKLDVLSHHTQLYNRIYEDAKLSNKVNYYKEEIKEWISRVENIHSEYFDSIFERRLLPVYVEADYLGEIELNEAIRGEIEKLRRKQNKNRNIRAKAIYSLCLSIIKHCDIKASENFEGMNLEEGTYDSLLFEMRSPVERRMVIDKINYDPRSVFNIDERTVLGVNKKGERIELYDFQSQITMLNGHGIISAPCGRGKTEGSLLGALNIIWEQNKNKIIFSLPTQITSNAMYERLKNIFGEDNVGIYHGMSRYLHYEDDEIKDEDVRGLVFDERVFEKPVTITTIDHLIYSLVHGYKQADFAFGNILNSVIIFDEIHYYETHTLRYILDSLRIFRAFNIPYIAMSGTLPSFLVDELNGIQEHICIEDDEGMDFTPFIIEKESKSVFEVIDQIEKIYSECKNQIIIVNTVKRAKEMYRLLEDKIPKQDLYLLHSQFTFYDRWDKEKKIRELEDKRPWILVSTQAIEISVDISCDVMHTELAPIDAIGQRGGRLNRGGKEHKKEHFMYVYQTENHLPYSSKNDVDDYVERTGLIIKSGSVSFKTIKEWCDEVYSDVKLLPQNLETVFNKCILFGYSPKEIRYSEEKGNLVEVRDIEDITIDVIPEKYWYEIKSKPERIEMFKVKVPKWWYSSFGKEGFYLSEEINDRKYVICKIPYSKEYGFDVEGIGEEDESCIIC